MKKAQLCPWCLVNAGRTHGQRKCCQLRRLALAPRAVQAAYAEGMTTAEKTYLRPRLLAEMKRLRALRNENNGQPCPDSHGQGRE